MGILCIALWNESFHSFYSSRDLLHETQDFVPCSTRRPWQWKATTAALC